MQITSKRNIDPVKLQAIMDLRAQGRSRNEIMRSLGISMATYYRWLEEIETRRAEAVTGRDDDA